MKNILIIHLPNPSRKMHFQQAKVYGAALYLMMENPTWELEYVDHVVCANVRNIEEAVQNARALSQKVAIDGVVTFVEHAVPTAAAVAEALGLPFISQEAAYKSRNKYEMRQQYEAFGIKCPQYALVDSVDEARAFTEQAGYPVVVKPIIGGGSLAVLKINNEKELRAHFERMKLSVWETFKEDAVYPRAWSACGGKMLIEEYIKGIEISVESLTYEDVTEVLAIHDKQMPEESNFFPEVMFSTPTSFPRSIEEKVIQATRTANKALGIHCGATHTEYRITDDNELYIIETGARIGGGPIFLSVLNSTRINMIHKIMDVALGINPKIKKNQPKPIAFYQHFIDADGVVDEVDVAGIERIHQNPNLIELHIYRRKGDRIISEKRTLAHAHVIAKGETVELALKNVYEMAQNIHFRLTEGQI
ncbi:ATP-grasp domain-containing protein [Paenibacillus sp. S150]|uniref:ATP-grasp domain-containing protein n=1 Tax=Paenibacillus sp. S150 TaxID=2749826 RepID=UPI001C580A4A|nr:ATP-grasp domain-containing protein [Paenibacillus sp. S150]MBW4083896.1 ATP-grasp domain-containing protein [Paenibacillus sp. S150]